MSAPLALYFADLLTDLDDEKGDRRIDFVHDNARLPTPAVGRIASPYSTQDSSCHTRSTTSTIVSTASNGSTGSTSSTGSCRWDSNPSSGNKEKTDQLKRPKRPGRQNSDMNKDRPAKDDKPIERPRRTSSDNAKQQRRSKTDKPQRPKRTSSVEKRDGDRSEPLDKTLLQQKTVDGSDSGSENSLKEIFRSTQPRHTYPAEANPLPGTRTSPSRSVGDILGQSMEELKLAW